MIMMIITGVGELAKFIIHFGEKLGEIRRSKTLPYKQTHAKTHTLTHTHTCAYTYDAIRHNGMYMCVRVFYMRRVKF